MNHMHYEELLISELFISKYNRPVKSEVANLWAKHFNMKYVGTIIISHRDGHYYIVDGQHRVQAAKIRGIKTLPCLVHEGLTYQEEADMFVAMGKERHGLLVTALFNGECEAGNESALGLRQAVEKSGFNIGQGSGNYRIQSVQVLRSIYTKHGEKMIIDVLAVLRDAWGGIQKANGRLILLGIWQFLEAYELVYKRERLILVLEKIKPGKIIAEAKGDQSSKSDKVKAAMAVLNAYNRGLVNKLPSVF